MGYTPFSPNFSLYPAPTAADSNIQYGGYGPLITKNVAGYPVYGVTADGAADADNPTATEVFRSDSYQICSRF